MRRHVTHGAQRTPPPKKKGSHQHHLFRRPKQTTWFVHVQRSRGDWIVNTRGGGYLTCHSDAVKSTSWYSEWRYYNNDLTTPEWSSYPVTQPEACSSMTLGVSKGSGLQRGGRDPPATFRQSQQFRVYSSCFCWNMNRTILLKWWAQSVSLTLKHLSSSALKDSLYND